ncbi:S41 family peptidase [Allofournierella massiliensis]|uniref:S41 family peptidase n=1 Tax=Allofournierella massiliensis TaxID=1650663 RepID=A0ABT7URV3_9FIRM|nr:S41 family peptidase [Fournierella massiliensis]MDM8201612.1 S41 family peptidase [Fournierella massiliensis]
MNKKISISMALTIAIIAMTVTFSITMILARQMFDATIPSVKEKESMYSKIAELDKYVRANYYGDIQDATLNDMMAYGYVLGIGDKNASYYTAKQYAELVEVQNGNIMGIGVDVVKDSSGYARITKVYDSSPASELGLQVGGFITAINGGEVKGLTAANVTAQLQGEAGTEVTVTYMAPDGTTADHTINRSRYTIPSVEYQMLGESYGYIKIYRFDGTTQSTFSKAVEDLQNQGAKALVFDLRDNAGGQMDVAVNCIDQLVPEADIVFAEDKNGEQTLLGSSDESHVDLPMVVLVNSGTASTAELFAASLRQLSGAQLVGTTTAGKGTIQAEPYRMSDGSAVVITTAKMLTSDKTSFDGIGLTVDVEVAAKADGSDTTLVSVEEDTQVQKALGVAQTMNGGTTTDDTSSSAASGDASASQSTSEGGEAVSEGADSAAPASESTDGE